MIEELEAGGCLTWWTGGVAVEPGGLRQGGLRLLRLGIRLRRGGASIAVGPIPGPVRSWRVAPAYSLAGTAAVAHRAICGNFLDRSCSLTVGCVFELEGSKDGIYMLGAHGIIRRSAGTDLMDIVSGPEPDDNPQPGPYSPNIGK